MLRDEPCKYIQPPGRALGIRDAAHVGGEIESLRQPDDVNRVWRQQCRLAQIDSIDQQVVVNLLQKGGRLAWEEAGSNMKCLLSKPEINAGRLDLLIFDRQSIGSRYHA